MDNDLAQILARRKRINTGREPPPCKSELSQEHKQLQEKMQGGFNPFVAFPNLSRKQIKDYERTFKSYDTGRKGYLNIEDVRKLMEAVGRPQTHLTLKKLINEARQKEDAVALAPHPINTLSFFGFLSMFDETEDEPTHPSDNSLATGVNDLIRQQSIEVHETGVRGAKDFFSAKISQQSLSNQAEQEIRAEQEQRKKAAEVERQRKADFKNRLALFNN